MFACQLVDNTHAAAYNDPMDTNDRDEIWKPVPSLGGALEVSSQGRVRRLARPLIYKDGRRGTLRPGLISGTVGKTGYVSVSFGKEKLAVHRLVAEAFHGLPEEIRAYQTVNHKNGNKIDNRPENIEWASYRSNQIHARETGLNRQHGTNCNLAKYSDAFIQAVRNVHARYAPTYAELAEMFGLGVGHAYQIVKWQTRKKPTT